MLIFALIRHHPNPKVGDYNQHNGLPTLRHDRHSVDLCQFLQVDIRYVIGAWIIGALILVS